MTDHVIHCAILSYSKTSSALLRSEKCFNVILSANIFGILLAILSFYNLLRSSLKRLRHHCTKTIFYHYLLGNNDMCRLAANRSKLTRNLGDANIRLCRVVNGTEAVD